MWGGNDRWGGRAEKTEEGREKRSSLALLQKVICHSAHINMGQNTLMDSHTAHFIDEIRERQRGTEGRRRKERQLS